MRFMMIVKADSRTEAGELPSREGLDVMGRYNQQLIDAGVLIDGAGLQPSSKGARVTFSHGKVHVTDGPFMETKELIAGYWIIKAASKQEAIEWAKRIPFEHIPGSGRTPEVEIRQFFDVEDFPDVSEAVLEQQKSFKRDA